MESNTSSTLPLPKEPKASLPLPMRTMQPRASDCAACVAGEQAECKLETTMLELSRGRAFAPVQRQHMIQPAPVRDRERRNNSYACVADRTGTPPNIPAPVQPPTMKSQGHVRKTRGAQPPGPASPQLLAVDSQQDQDEITGAALLRHLDAIPPLGVGRSSNSSVSGEIVSTNAHDVDNPHSARAAQAAADQILGSQYVVGRMTVKTIELGGQVHTYRDIDKEFSGSRTLLVGDRRPVYEQSGARRKQGPEATEC
ncbi:hypothetical protein PSPO01_07975 [Paraphaeosphaeria sporulosa]